MSTENVKVNRRGIANSAKKTILRFHEKDSCPVQGPALGLFNGHLAVVEVTKSTIKEDAKGLQSFAGKEIPRLQIRFESNHTNEAERRHYTMSFNPIESNVDTIPGGSAAWQVDNLFTWMNNLLEIFYLNGRALNEEEENALTLNFEDYDDSNNYIPVEPDDVIKGYTVLFENFAAMMNGKFGTKEQEATGKPCYFTDKGTIIPLWMKLTRYQKTKNGWRETGNNGELAFDVFYRTPLIEKMKGNNPPVLVSLDTSRESIIPQKVEKKTPTIGGQANGAAPIAAGGVMMGGAIPMGMMQGNAGAEAGIDVPF